MMTVSSSHLSSDPVAPAGAAVSLISVPPKIEEFWGVEACGTNYVKARLGTPDFYEEFRRIRYESEWHIPRLVPFAETEGKDVLEIGCGNGADGTMFARAGARYTGVDLTRTAVDATRLHFDTLGLSGTFQVENAETLSFPNESFDFVYSHGVLHHTSNPRQAFAEVYRILRPGGRAVLMLYHKHSFNYYVRIMGYMRARLLLHILRRFGRISKDRSRVEIGKFLSLRGNTSPTLWQAHYQNFLRYGWSYMRSKNFVHRATDGPECPFAFVYTRQSVCNELRQFRGVETRCAHLPLRKYSIARWVPLPVERFLASYLGWYLFVYATK